MLWLTNATAETDRIQSLIAEGKLRQALTLTDRQLQEDEKSVTYRFLKGLILTRMNELDQARVLFVELTNDHPELPEPYNNLAVIYASQGDFEKARDALQKAISTHPSYATAHENMGDIYAKMASKAYNQALELDSDNTSAKAKLSLVNDLFFVPDSQSDVSTSIAKVVPEASSQEPAMPEQTQVLAQAEAAQVAEAEQRKQAEERLRLEQERAQQAAEEKKRKEQELALKQAEANKRAEQQRAAQLAEEKKLKTEKLKTQVSATVDSWATAWSSKDAEKYISFYGKEFTPPKKLSRKAWEAQRKVRLAKPRYIKIKISQLDISMLGDDHARAKFRQGYQSDTYRDEVNKTLILKKAADSWLITQEQSN